MRRVKSRDGNYYTDKATNRNQTQAQLARQAGVSKRTIGAVSMDDRGVYAAFQYDPAFARSGIEVSPITMPLGDRIYTYPTLPAAAAWAPWSVRHQRAPERARRRWSTSMHSSSWPR
jgi:hypothetical protein